MAILPENIFQILKKEMKVKKVKYEDLADKLGMSLSGLKKSFSSDDLSLTRLQSICDALGVSIVHVLTMADDSKVKDVYLTDEQENLLLKNPKVFHLYWKLRFEAVPLHQYIQQSKEAREEVRSRLRQLEKVGLVKIDARGDLEFSDRGMIRWNNYGPLAEYLNRNWSRELIDSILRKKDPGVLLNLALLKLTDANCGHLKNELQELLERYSTLSQRDQFQFKESSLKKVALLIAADEHQFVK